MTARSLLMSAAGAQVGGDPYYQLVELLLHGEGVNGGTVFLDNSVYQRAVNTGGFVTTSTAEKQFGQSSLSFTNVASYLSANINTLGTADWTFETATYGPQTASDIWVIGNSAAAWGVGLHTGPSKELQVISGGVTIISGPQLPATGWHHIAVTRQSGIIRLWLDGAQVGADAAHTTNMTSTSIIIGNNALTTASALGYQDEVRITKGVARYFGPFTPPAEQHPDNGSSSNYEAYYNNTPILLHCEGADGAAIFNNDGFGNAPVSVVSGTPTTSTAQKKFGTSSIYCNTADSEALRFNLPVSMKYWTVEFWVYPVKMAGVNGLFRVGTGASGQLFKCDITSGDLLQIISDGAGVGGTTTLPIQYGVWTHIAVCYASQTTVTMYVNGVRVITLYKVSDGSLTNTFQLGFGSGYGHAYFDEVRYTLGVCRYFNDFTPQTAPFEQGLPVCATWNPLDKGASINLTNNNLTATSAGATGTAIRATKPVIGLRYWEIKLANVSGLLIGVATGAADREIKLGYDPEGWARTSNNKVHDAVLAAYGAAMSVNAYAGVLYDADTGRLGFMQAGTYYGMAYPDVVGTLFPAAGFSTTSGSAIANFGQTPWQVEIPACGTFWNRMDGPAATTIYEGYMVAGSTGATAIATHTNTFKSSGKWYFEITVGEYALEIGIDSAAVSTNAGQLGTKTTAWRITSDGSKGHDNNYTAYGTVSPKGTIIGVAVDLDAGTMEGFKNGVSMGGLAWTGITLGQQYKIGLSAIDLFVINGMKLNPGNIPFANPLPAGFLPWDSSTVTAGIY